MYAEGHRSQSYQDQTQNMRERAWNDSVSQRSQRQSLLRCANCDIDILWPPVVVQGKTYCCIGCAAGGPCNCDYSEYSSVSISGVIYYGTDVPKNEDEAGRS